MNDSTNSLPKPDLMVVARNITIDEAIRSLQEMKNLSILGGDTVLHVVMDEVTPIPVSGIALEQDQDGAIVTIRFS